MNEQQELHNIYIVLCKVLDENKKIRDKLDDINKMMLNNPNF